MEEQELERIKRAVYSTIQTIVFNIITLKLTKDEIFSTRYYLTQQMMAELFIDSAKFNGFPEELYPVVASFI